MIGSSLATYLAVLISDIGILVIPEMFDRNREW